jgi:diacylglycerol kinase (ATP)
MRHLVFVVNPKSGVDRTKAIEGAIEQYLDKSIYSYEIQFTKHAGHGTELAKNASLSGAYAVVAVGGDGSVNDIIRGLYGTKTVLAILPKGSGNGLARTLKIPLSLAEGIQTINRGRTENIDLGKANAVLFASNAGVGYDALVCKKFASSTKRGLATYAWIITKYMWLYKDWTWNIKIDGKQIEQTAFFISVSNGSQFGYNFKIAADASWTDGLLDVVIIKKFPKILAAVLGVRMLRGTLLKSPYVQRIRATNVTISHPDLKLMQVDGDPKPCEHTIEYQVLPQAQTVIVGNR